MIADTKSKQHIVDNNNVQQIQRGIKELHGATTDMLSFVYLFYLFNLFSKFYIVSVISKPNEITYGNSNYYMTFNIIKLYSIQLYILMFKRLSID